MDFLPKKIPLIVSNPLPTVSATVAYQTVSTRRIFFFTLFIVHPLTIFFFFTFFRFVNRPNINKKIRRVIFYKHNKTETLEIRRTEAGEVSGSGVRVVDAATAVFARIGSAVSAH